jgi:hypothetical protein
MDIKLKTHDIQTWGKKDLFLDISSTNIDTLVPSLYQCVKTRFMRQTLPNINRKHFFMNILCIESFCQQKTHNRTLLFGDILLKYSRHFDYRNHPLNMHMSCLAFKVCTRL